jgi:hypothetical protein
MDYFLLLMGEVFLNDSLNNAKKVRALYTAMASAKSSAVEAHLPCRICHREWIWFKH